MSGFLTMISSFLVPVAKQAVMTYGHDLVDYLTMILS